METRTDDVTTTPYRLKNHNLTLARRPISTLSQRRTPGSSVSLEPGLGDDAPTCLTHHAAAISQRRRRQAVEARGVELGMRRRHWGQRRGRGRGERHFGTHS